MKRKSAVPPTESKKKARVETEPKFPYTTKPSSLRKLLQEIPKRPRPPRFDKTLLRSWGFNNANDYSMIRVLKAVGLLNATNAPTELYAQYVQLEGGAASLAEPLKKIYAPLFTASHKPYGESNERLQNLFNIHSGGGARALDQQIQTFKALAENTDFEFAGSGGATVTVAPPPGGGAADVDRGGDRSSGPAVHIDLHIHLPENKSRRDYETIIEDIGRYTLGRDAVGRRDE